MKASLWKWVLWSDLKEFTDPTSLISQMIGNGWWLGQIWTLKMMTIMTTLDLVPLSSSRNRDECILLLLLALLLLFLSSCLWGQQVEQPEGPAYASQSSAFSNSGISSSTVLFHSASCSGIACSRVCLFYVFVFEVWSLMADWEQLFEGEGWDFIAPADSKRLWMTCSCWESAGASDESRLLIFPVLLTQFSQTF